MVHVVVSGLLAVVVEQCNLLLLSLPPSLFQLIMVDELKNDYRNPLDFSKNLNRVSVVGVRVPLDQSVSTLTLLVSLSLFYQNMVSTCLSP